MLKKNHSLPDAGGKRVLLALIAAGLMAPALAQVEAQSSKMLEEVVVTATKRETSLMETPIAISAFNQEALTREGIKDVTDLVGKVPNLFITTDNVVNAVEFTMRGVGSNNNTELGDPTVGFHVDGIYSPRPQGSMVMMYDLERLEVLRGPQGTLFGRNSTVGTINMVTAKPDVTGFSALAEASVGKYSHRQVRGTVNVPLSDSFAVRANYFVDQRDSYLTEQISDTDAAGFNTGKDQRRNTNPDESDWFFNSDQKAYRIASLFEPSDAFSWRLTYEKFEDNGAGGINLQDCDLSPCQHGDQYTVLINHSGFLDFEVENIRNTLAYDFGGIELKYNYGFSDQERAQWNEEDLGLVDPTNPGVANFDVGLGTIWSDYESTTHEIQLQSTDDGPFQWTVGLFTFEEENAIRFDVDLPDIPGGLVFLQPKRVLSSDAVFAQGVYSLRDDLRLTLGYRKTEDEKSDTNGGNYSVFGPDYLGGQADRSLTNGTFGFNPVVDPDTGMYGLFNRDSDNTISDSWDKDTYRLGVDYDLSMDALLYAYVATGFKSGGFGDVVVVNGVQTAFNYKPEEVITYEFGYKATLMGGTMNLSAALFHSKYQDMQRTVIITLGEDPVTGADLTQLVTRNAAESTINGLEVEVDWLVGDNGRFSGFVAWLDAEIDDWLTQDNRLCAERFGADGCPIENLSGNKLANSPEWKFTLSYEHTFNMENGARIIPWISLHWEDDYFLRDFNNDEPAYSSHEDAWSTIDLSVRYASADDSWYAELYGTNVTDEVVKTRWADTNGVVVGAYNAPAMYGVRAGFRW